MKLLSWSLVPVVMACSAVVYAANIDNVGADREALVARGNYLVSIMDCTGCHTAGALRGAPDPQRFLAGSDIGFGTPQAIVYPPNLTPDVDTGLGRWSDAEVVTAITSGQRPDGRMLSPVMPWPSYARLSSDDARAVVAYLRTIPAVSFAVPTPVMAGSDITFPYMTLAMPASK